MIPQNIMYELKLSMGYTKLELGVFFLTDVQYSTDEYESLSEDDDFLIVPLPACFDFSKPVVKPQESENSSSDSEAMDGNHNLVDDNHNTIVTSELLVQYGQFCLGRACFVFSLILANIDA